MKKLFIILSTFIVIPLTSCGPRGVKTDVVILFTNDTHGTINKKLSFATASQMKRDLISNGEDVLLFDSGDIISGGFYTTYDNGKSMIDFMNEAGYDAATLGNHEFDYDFSYLDELIKHANFPFISTNFYHMKNDKPTTRYTDLGSKIFTLNNNIKVGVIGISTPESITASTPSHFQDEEGHYIYTFLDKDNEIYNKAQEEINSIRDKCNYVICLSHLGDEEQTGKFTASQLASNTSGIDIILDGHTHFSVPGKTVKDKNKKDVFITQAGGTFSHIGKLTIKHDGSIHNELISTYPSTDLELKKKEVKVMKELDDRLATKIAHSDTEFSKLDSKREFNLGDLSAEAPYYYYNMYLPSIGVKEDTSCDLTVVNTGGIRLNNIPKGDWTLKTCKETHPFGNGVCLIELDGKTLRNALECSCYNLPNYFGGLQQVCGVRMEVNTSITSDIEFDANRNYFGGPYKNFRLSNIEIYNKKENKYEPLEDVKTYRVGGSSYVLLNGGDGMSMFKQGKLIRQEMAIVDSTDLIMYVASFAKDETGYPFIDGKNSPLNNQYPKLGINYTDSGYSKRIVTY